MCRAERFTMSDDLLSDLIDLVQDALLKSFWRKNAFLTFLRRHKISEHFLTTWQEIKTKRMFIQCRVAKAL